MCDKITDIEGRILIAKLTINEISFIICNVYAPTRGHKKEQIYFINSLKDKLSSLEQHNLLIGGDLNLYLDPKLDKQDSLSNKNDRPEFRREIVSLIESFSLVDCWRVINPKTQRYTWHARNKSSRLDSWLISEHLLNEIKKCNITYLQECVKTLTTVLHQLKLENNFVIQGKVFGN